MNIPQYQVLKFRWATLEMLAASTRSSSREATESPLAASKGLEAVALDEKL